MKSDKLIVLTMNLQLHVIQWELPKSVPQGTEYDMPTARGCEVREKLTSAISYTFVMFSIKFCIKLTL